MNYEVTKVCEAFEHIPATYAVVNVDTKETIAVIEQDMTGSTDWEVNIPGIGDGKTVESFDSVSDAMAWALRYPERIENYAARLQRTDDGEENQT